jgi:hypothetical protein
MALLSFCGISTPSLTAQGEQRRSSFFNIERDYSEIFEYGWKLSRTDLQKFDLRVRIGMAIAGACKQAPVNFRAPWE